MSLYHAVACQAGFPHACTKEQLDKNIDGALEMIRWTTEVYSSAAPVKLVAFGELNVCGFSGKTAREMREAGIQIPGPETERFVKLAKELDMYIMPGSWLERDTDHPLVFNTAFLVGPQGLLFKYRKYNPYLPTELSTSPHDLLEAGYDVKKNPLFPVAKTEIGNIGVFICYDCLFPEVTRQLAYNGAEILVGATAWTDPYGGKILDWWNTCTKARSIENLCYGLYTQSGSTVYQFAPWPPSGYSQIVDFEGRVLAIAGSKPTFISALFDIDLLRQYRKTVRQSNVLVTNRVEGFDFLKTPKRKTHPELAKKKDLTTAETEEMEIESLEAFYSKYYGEKVRFPKLGKEWWNKLAR